MGSVGKANIDWGVGYVVLLPSLQALRSGVVTDSGGGVGLGRAVGLGCRVLGVGASDSTITSSAAVLQYVPQTTSSSRPLSHPSPRLTPHTTGAHLPSRTAPDGPAIRPRTKVCGACVGSALLARSVLLPRARVARLERFTVEVLPSGRSVPIHPPPRSDVGTVCGLRGHGGISGSVCGLMPSSSGVLIVSTPGRMVPGPRFKTRGSSAKS